ncbi:hypothetical protein CMO94_03735 [Candidatus Woesearchaeota archaeon]|jgi:hypothetical protein|nr:hypothetical protein [Candidatus Woesearchaeota archaeon]|tara:strand:+ start:752 stop:952 length:201 start_codon:yes stop_codon:yes gene_type:complete
MGKKYFDTKKNSIEDAVLNVWKKMSGMKVEEDKKDDLLARAVENDKRVSNKLKEDEKAKVLKEKEE